MTANEIDALFVEMGWSVEKTVNGGAAVWQMAIQFEQEPRHVTVTFPTKRGNLLTACKLLSPLLNGRNPALIPAQTLRTLIELQTTTGAGASVMILRDGTFAVC